MAVQRTLVRDVAVLQVSGDLFGGKETDQLQRAIAAEEAANTMRLVLDLSYCNHMNSTALSVLILAQRSFKARGALIKLCCLQRQVASLLLVPSLSTYFGYYPGIEEAAASFVQGSPAS